MEDRGTSCVESKLAHSQPGIYFVKIVKVENMIEGAERLSISSATFTGNQVITSLFAKLSYGPNFCNDEIQCLQVITSHWRNLAAIGRQKAKL